MIIHISRERWDRIQAQGYGITVAAERVPLLVGKGDTM